MKRIWLVVLLLLPWLVGAQGSNNAAGNLTAQGSGCLATNCVSMRFQPNTAAVTITLSGTWSATVQFEVSGDYGVTWVAAPGSTTSATSNGTTQFSVSAYTMMRARVSAFTSGTVSVTIIGSTTSGAGGSTSTTGLAPNSSIMYVSPQCGTQTNCYAVKGDVRVTADCATTNNNATVTSATAAFTAADVGKLLFCINRATGAIVNRGTVSSVQSATSITSSANSTATTTLANLEVGTDDALAFHNAYNAAITANQGIALPCGMFLLDSNAPVFNEGATGNISQNYSVSGCSDSGNTNSTTFILGPDLLDTAGDLVVSMPLAASGATFPMYNHGSSFGVSNLQITGLSYKSAAAFNVIDALRGYNLRIFDMNSTSACYAINALGAYGGEVAFDRLNIQINTGSLQTNTCGGVNIASGTSDSTAQGNNVISNSIFAFLSYKGVYFDAGGGSILFGVYPLLMLNDYMYLVGGATGNMMSVSNSGQVNIQGGLYWPNSATAGMFVTDGSANSGYNISNAIIYANSRPVFGPAGTFIKMRDTVIKGISASTFFESTNIATSHFYNLGGNSLSALPTTNVPLYVNTSSEAQTVTCSSSAATVTYTGTYLANPFVSVYDRTTTGLVTVTSQNLTTLVLGCPGASDVLNVTLTPNGF